jgi:hypothetical protein
MYFTLNEVEIEILGKSHILRSFFVECKKRGNRANIFFCYGSDASTQQNFSTRRQQNGTEVEYNNTSIQLVS